MISMEGYTILLFFTSLLSIVLLSTATDTITISQSLKDGDTVVSAGGTFELGFFSPDNSTKRYLGTWYKKISPQTVFWVANREIPLLDSSGLLNFTKQGILQLVNYNESIIWSSNSSRLVLNPVAQLLDSGNLVIKDANDNNPENFLWQSFDYPCDTLMPTMKLGKNLVTGLDRHFSAWKSSDDPSQGDYTFWLDSHGFPEVILSKGSVEEYRMGPWNGFRFSGIPSLKPNPFYKFGFVYNQEEVYYHYELLKSSMMTRLVISPNGIVQRFVWVSSTQRWVVLYSSGQLDACDPYALCGPYGSCNVNNSPECGCLKGFVPKIQKDWDTMDWSHGCVRKTPLDCQNGEGFNKYSGLKLPETRHSWYNVNMNLEECKIVCLKNCSCTAYANLDIKSGIGCLLWFGKLIDIRELTENEQVLYIRMAASELDQGDNAKINANSNVGKRVRIIVIAVLSTAVLLGLAMVLFVWMKKHNKARKVEFNKEGDLTNESQKEDLESPLFDMATLVNATDNFSINNKLGEGGFGPVYKGMLEDGQEIAVKRLSKNSTQGLDEFKNEVIHIIRLQHRNLVKLLGCCIQGDEKMLIYELMPNKSLDFFIFDYTRSILLDWSKRFHIINGIAQGLLYLHRDSRLRIIHRDLKASNILLDNEMNAKIADFGLARSFAGNETEANTNRVVGTYGYMSPEYAIDGQYSIKSDVYSFGVLLLEVVCGKKNRGFYHLGHHHNLTGHAWILHIEGRSLELIDASIGDSYNPSEVLRSIHVGLLCVQRYPEDRPSMSSVVLMLGSESILPQPKQPGFFTEINIVEGKSSSSKRESFTTTLLEPR